MLYTPSMVMQNGQILVPLYEDLTGDPDFLSTYKMRFFQQKSRYVNKSAFETSFLRFFNKV